MVRVIIGPNSFALKNALRDTKDAFIKKYGDLSVETIDAEESEYEGIIPAIESVPFLAEKKLLVIHELGNNKAAVENIEKIVSSAQSANELIIVESKPDKRSAYYKYLKKHTDLVEFGEPDERILSDWLVSEAEKGGAKLSRSDAGYLLRRIGINQESAHNELIKLMAYDKDISKKTIDLLTEASPQTNIFNLLEASFSGNLKRALEIYDEQRTQGEEPLKIFGLIVWQMHLVAMVDTAASKSDAQIMEASGLKPYTLNKSKSIGRRMGRQRIKEVLSRLSELDHRLKMTQADPDDALKSFILSLS